MLIITLATIALAAPFEFKGGSLLELAGAASAYFATPSIIAVERSDVEKLYLKWPTNAKGEELPLESGNEIQLKLVANHIESSFANRGGVHAFRRKAMPWHRFQAMYQGRDPLQTFRLSGELIGVEKGIVTLSPKAGVYFSPTFLPLYPFVKPVSSHKFFENYPIVYSKGVIAECDFLESLAESIGARVVESERSVFLDVDIEKIRSQLIEKFRSDGASSKSALAKAKSDFQVEAMKIVPDGQLRDMLEKENYNDVVSMAMVSKVNQYARRYVELYLNEAQKPNGDPLARKEIAEMARQNGNFNRPFKILLESRGKVEVFVLYGDSGGGVGM